MVNELRKRREALASTISGAALTAADISMRTIVVPLGTTVKEGLARGENCWNVCLFPFLYLQHISLNPS